MQSLLDGQQICRRSQLILLVTDVVQGDRVLFDHRDKQTFVLQRRDTPLNSAVIALEPGHNFSDGNQHQVESLEVGRDVQKVLMDLHCQGVHEVCVSKSWPYHVAP